MLRCDFNHIAVINWSQTSFEGEDGRVGDFVVSMGGVEAEVNSRRELAAD